MFLLLFICLAVVVIITYRARSSCSASLQCPNIPSISKVPFIGGLLVLASFKPDNLHLKFGEFVSRYGKSFRAEVLGVHVIVSADRQISSALLASHQHLHKHKLYLLLRKWLGNGLLLSHGRVWQTMRKILTPTFHFQILEEFLGVFDKQCGVFIEKLRQHAGDGQQAVDISGMVDLLTLDTIAETAMGVQIKAQQGEGSDFVVAIKDITKVLFTRTMRPHLAFPGLFRLFAPTLHRKQSKSIQFLHEFTRRIIEQRHTGLLNDQTSEEPTPPKRRRALLDVLLSASIDGAPLSHQQIEDEVNTFMFEGHDTTSSAASFCLYLLSRHPSRQTKLFDEIATHFGQDFQRPLQYGDLQKLTYLDCVVRESLRLYPPIPAIGRWLKTDLQTQCGTLPAGCNVILLLWQILRDPEVYPEPDAFKPERFMETMVEGAKLAYSSIPFSAGPRNCIGQRFALNEIKTIVIRTLQTFELVEAGEAVQPLIRFVLSSKTGINMGLRVRVS